MSKYWQPEDDKFLMRWHSIGIDFISDHDLGRSPASGKARFRFLTKSGARLAFSEMMVSMIKFEHRAGHNRSSVDKSHADREFYYWRGEVLACGGVV